MTQELEFDASVKFHPGSNLTVRRGNKWAEHKEARIGSTVRPIATRVVTFRSLASPDLRDHHDPKCRTVEGLYRELFHQYRYFSKDETVTLVRFMI